MEPDAVQRQHKPLECRLILVGALSLLPLRVCPLFNRSIAEFPPPFGSVARAPRSHYSFTSSRYAGRSAKQFKLRL